MNGGEPGKSGKQYKLQKDGSRIELKNIDNTDMDPGDRLIIHTPGGGGFGPPTEK
jgi:5-oxoprolinase (ATP-hydrolysing)